LIPSIAKPEETYKKETTPITPESISFIVRKEKINNQQGLLSLLGISVLECPRKYTTIINQPGHSTCSSTLWNSHTLLMLL
jgi:hypothetical protein